MIVASIVAWFLATIPLGIITGKWIKSCEERV